jgi:hypothetical protein
MAKISQSYATVSFSTRILRNFNNVVTAEFNADFKTVKKIVSKMIGQKLLLPHFLHVLKKCFGYLFYNIFTQFKVSVKFCVFNALSELTLNQAAL